MKFLIRCLIKSRSIKKERKVLSVCLSERLKKQVKEKLTLKLLPGCLKKNLNKKEASCKICKFTNEKDNKFCIAGGCFVMPAKKAWGICCNRSDRECAWEKSG